LPFRFRFAAILELRRRERDEAGAAVGQANEAMEKIQLQIRSKQDEREQLKVDANTHRTGDVSVDVLLSRGRYDLQLQAEIHACQQTLGELRQECERRQAKLVACDVELKRFEKLRDRAEDLYRKDQLRHEQTEAEDATTRRYILQRQR
jgi:flagellar FliJ protein